MALPLYLAFTAAEIIGIPDPSFLCAYMSCQFSPYTEGLTNIPVSLPQGCMLMLNDRYPCQGHSADLVVSQLQQVVDRLNCESILLDFQRPPEPESEWMVKQIIQSLSVPVAATETYGTGLPCPIFLPPAPLHMPLAEYLAPWQDREVWLEAALCQEDLHITEKGMSYNAIFPTDMLTGGYHDEALCCHYQSQIDGDQITFTLFDTVSSLGKKLELARSLGVNRAVGLWQELSSL